MTGVNSRLPSHLYRHRGYTAEVLSPENLSAKKRLVSEVENAKLGKVWFSPLSEQNDIHDTSPRLTISPTNEIQRVMNAFKREFGINASISGQRLQDMANEAKLPVNLVRKQYYDAKRISPGVLEQHSQIRSRQMISCLTRDPVSPLMWAYYSSSHQSFCYEFERVQNLDQSATVGIVPVNYLDERPEVSSVEILKWLIRSSRPHVPIRSRILLATPEEEKRLTDAFVSAKSSHWKHENEWRALLPIGLSSGFYALEFYRLKSVLVGERCAPDLRSLISEMVGGEIEIRTVRASDHGYDLKVE